MAPPASFLRIAGAVAMWGMESCAHWKDRGDAALAVGDMAGAARCYRASVEADGGFAEGWHALAMASLKLGQAAGAVEAARRAAELVPGDAMYWTSLSIALARDHRVQEAEDAAGRARIVSWGGRADAKGEPGAGG